MSSELDQPETEAARAVTLLPCPICGKADPVCRPKKGVVGSRFVCQGCGFEVIAPNSGIRSGWRDGAQAWNQEARRG